ncbi:MAG: hypothetical protein ACE5IO_07455 [Thermoplasmata archaeon]
MVAMGTTTVRRNSASKSWKKTTEEVLKQNAEDAADVGVKTGLSLLPDGPTKVPTYSAVREVYKFGQSVKKHGWTKGAKQYAIGKAGKETGKSVGQAIWNASTGGGSPPGIDPTATRAMRTAFITTCGKIGSKGAKAI